MSIVSGIFQAKATERAADTQAGASAEAVALEREMWQQSREDLKPFMDAAREQIPQVQRGQRKFEDLLQEYKNKSEDWNHYKNQFASVTNEFGEVQQKFKTLAEEFGGVKKEYSDLVSQGPGEYKESDYYDYLINQAAKATDRSVAAGRLATGTVPKALTEYAIPLAANERSKWVDEWLQTKLNPTLNKSNLLSQQLAAKTDEANIIGSKSNSLSNEMGVYNNQLASLLTQLNASGQMGGIGSTPYLSSVSSGTGANQNTGNAISNLMQNRGAAEASGILGGASAISNASQNTINNAMNAYKLYKWFA
ncbi:MAG: hypothetical protein HQK79_14160 [Desulfobacterales bacterium]|nr:hypothetical protein [Desulfobacterales bacterium]